MAYITLTYKKDITKNVFKDALQKHDQIIVRVDEENLKQFGGAASSVKSIAFDASRILYEEPLKKEKGTILFLNNEISGLNSIAETRIALLTFNVRVLVVEETLEEINVMRARSMLLEILGGQEEEN